MNYWQFELHPRLMQQTLDGAIAAGVKRLVLIGTVYPYGRPQTRPVREDHPRDPHTFKGRMRKAQEDLLLAAHANGKIQAAVLRLPDSYGPGVDKSFLHSAFTAAATGGVANMVGPLDTPHEFVFVPDVGPVVARLTSTPTCTNACGTLPEPARRRSGRSSRKSSARPNTGCACALLGRPCCGCSACSTR